MMNPIKLAVDNQRIQSILISILTSGFICLIFYLIINHRLNQGSMSVDNDIHSAAPRHEHLDSRADDIASKPDSTKYDTILKRLDDLESALKSEIRRQDSNSTTRLDDIFTRLTNITESGRQKALNQCIAGIIDFGDNAVDKIIAFLQKGTDYQYEEWFSSSGHSITSHASLRSSLVDALIQIGSPKAKTAILDIIKNPKSLSEITTLMALCQNSSDSLLIHQFRRQLPRLMEMCESGELKGSESMRRGSSDHSRRA